MYRTIKFLLFLLVCFFVFASNSNARENVTYWYVKDFNSEIIVNKDSSLDITETIIADCGTGIDKHGIFRILPEVIKVEGRGKIKTPIELISITDSLGNPYEYTTSKNTGNKTVTWKIGDANKTVQGVNTYVIRYRVENAVRFWDDNFDELYWNLTGNFWDLEIDKAKIRIIFPSEVNKDNSLVSLYSGSLGAKSSSLAEYQWSNRNVLEVESTKILPMKNGITASITFPKNIFTQYKPSLWEMFKDYLFLLIPVGVFVFCFRFWKKYGDDPDFDRTLIAQYEPPKDMSPVEIGLLMNNGTLKNEFITAEIIKFATEGIISIEEDNEKLLFFNSKDYKFIRKNNQEAESKLNQIEKDILDKIFSRGDVIKLSSLKNNFYKILSNVKKNTNELLANKNLIVAKGVKYSYVMIPIGAALTFFGLFHGSAIFGIWFGLATAISGAIVLIFGLIMPKRTFEGAEMNWKLKGFKLFMETVSVDRAKFYEKENIFEKFLPYAVLFEITDIWIRRIKEIYGEEYFSNYVPTWYIGSNLSSFDVDTFDSAISSLSNSISANTSAPSGSGGSGGAGGGGGGGGGGGW